MTGPRFTDLIARLPETVPFVGPEGMERDRGARFSARLGANESVFGPSPFAIAAMQDEAADVWKYADATQHDLKGALSERLGCAPENLVMGGAGIDGLLGNLVRLLVAPGDAVVTSEGAYPTFNYHVAGFGGDLHKVPYRDDREDAEALFARAAEVDAKIVYLANPDNPMGSWHEGQGLERALAALPEGCILALDEAYIEFAPEGTALPVAYDDPRVIRFRTFSKAYGMAGARVGYAIGAPGLIRAFDRVRNHFEMNRPAQVGALAALEDDTWLQEVLRLVEEAKARIGEIAIENGLVPLPSATNFVAIDCGRDGDFARKVLSALLDEGIFVRMPGVAPLDRCIRISAGAPADLDALATALPRALMRAQEAG